MTGRLLVTDASYRPDGCKHLSPGLSYTDSTPPKFVKDDYSEAAKGWRIPDSQAVDWWTSSRIGAMSV